MNKLITTFLIQTLFVSMMAAWNYYSGPEDERMVPGYHDHNFTLGWLAQVNNVAALADVIEVQEITPDSPHGSFKVRVVNAIFGCTNGQELVIAKSNPNMPDAPPTYDPLFEYYPTNHSRIVFAAIVPPFTGTTFRHWRAKEWNMPPQPDILVSDDRNGTMYGFTRSWWYEDYQNGLPYAHFTNLVRAVRVERNWTNYYHIVRDAVPSPSERVWSDSFTELEKLYFWATPELFRFMYHDPLLDNEVRANMADWHERMETPFPLDE